MMFISHRSRKGEWGRRIRRLLACIRWRIWISLL